jgi:hypothetical protein
MSPITNPYQKTNEMTSLAHLDNTWFRPNYKLHRELNRDFNRPTDAFFALKRLCRNTAIGKVCFHGVCNALNV